MDEDTKFLVKFGCGSTVGGRPYQEDRLVATRLNGSANQTFFAVYDGHGGDRCSEYLSRNFHKSLLSHTKFNSLPIAAIQETWNSFDDQCLSQFKKIETADAQHILPADGSTATACLIVGNDIYLTNCGDSSAYSISSDGKCKLLTEDHGTNNTEEVNRCLKAGGQLKPQTYTVPAPFPFCCISQVKAAKPRMMPGGLLVTRSFGDFNAKLEYLGGKKGVVTSQHGKISYINAGKSTPKYIVLASDGVWDVLSIEEVTKVIEDYFSRKQATAATGSVTTAAAITTNGSSGGVNTSDTTATATSAPVKTVSKSPKSSPRHVHPLRSTPAATATTTTHTTTVTGSNSMTDLVEGSATANMVMSELINARYSDLDTDLNELATVLVNTAASSPKWAKLGEKPIKPFNWIVFVNLNPLICLVLIADYVYLFQ